MSLSSAALILPCGFGGTMGAGAGAAWLLVITDDGVQLTTWVNLSSGAIGTTSHASATVADLGGGWYRVVLTGGAPDDVEMKLVSVSGNNLTGRQNSTITYSNALLSATSLV